MTNDSISGELIDELTRLRATISSLEAELATMAKRVHDREADLRTTGRETFTSEIAAMQVFDVIQANGIDISEGGFGCEAQVPLRFLFNFVQDGVTREEDCELMWARGSSDGGTRMGFRFRQKSEEQDRAS